MKINKELLKGTTGLVVLTVIAEQDMYGYQITQTVKARTDSALVLNEGTLYPILHSYEKMDIWSLIKMNAKVDAKENIIELLPKGNCIYKLLFKYILRGRICFASLNILRRRFDFDRDSKKAHTRLWLCRGRICFASPQHRVCLDG